MVDQSSIAELGAPDLKVLGFSLWVHGRAYPEADFAWERNSLRVSAYCADVGASVWVEGPDIISVPDIADFAASCDAMHRFESQSAVLDSNEPNLKIRLEATDDFGHLCATVELTPDHHRQQHLFRFDADQSYLPEIIRQCRGMVKEYPDCQKEA